jgi:hypothetical protein
MSAHPTKEHVMKKSVLSFVLLIAAGWASAQTIIPTLDTQGRKGDMARMAQEKAAARFDSADKNKDGKLSKEETAELPYIEAKFEVLDKDKDGFLSWEEFVGHNRWKKEPAPAPAAPAK